MQLNEVTSTLTLGSTDVRDPAFRPLTLVDFNYGAIVAARLAFHAGFTVEFNGVLIGSNGKFKTHHQRITIEG